METLDAALQDVTPSDLKVFIHTQRGYVQTNSLRHSV